MGPFSFAVRTAQQLNVASKADINSRDHQTDIRKGQHLPLLVMSILLGLSATSQSHDLL